jgi:hypothetical protein
MKHGGIIIAICFLDGVLNISLRADDAVLSGNPYAVVSDRNVFGLNPPVVNTTPITVEPPVKIIPNGIISIFGQLEVLFKAAAKPGEKETSYDLTEGQSQDDIEVTKINEKDSIVTFNNHGIVQELPLVVTAPSSAPASPIVGKPAISANTGVNPFMNRFGNRGEINQINQIGGNNNSVGGGNGGSNPRAIPTRGGNTTMNSVSGQQNTMTAEEAIAATVIAKAKAFQDGSLEAPIFPPTPLDKEANLPSNEAPTPTTPAK